MLILALLTPSLVKFSHIFENHVHTVCENPMKSHFHEIDFDCEFYKFKLKTQLAFSTLDFQCLKLEENYQRIASQYQHLSEYKQLNFSLRGPPQLI